MKQQNMQTKQIHSSCTVCNYNIYIVKHVLVPGFVENYSEIRILSSHSTWNETGYRHDSKYELYFQGLETMHYALGCQIELKRNLRTLQKDFACSVLWSTFHEEVRKGDTANRNPSGWKFGCSIEIFIWYKFPSEESFFNCQGRLRVENSSSSFNYVFIP